MTNTTFAANRAEELFHDLQTSAPHTEAPDVVQRLDPDDDYNFRHFRMRHMIAELVRTYRRPASSQAKRRPISRCRQPTGPSCTCATCGADRRCSTSSPTPAQ